MLIGGLTNKQLPNLKIRACYKDIIRKSKSIAYKIDIIKDMDKDLSSKLPMISESDDIILSGEIADCFEKMYSCMEYVAAIFREVLRDRGNLESKFHKLMQKTLKNTDDSNIYADKRIVNFVERALDWYAIVHDIRSEETHFSMGKLDTEDSKIVYKIQRQSGRETVYDLIRMIKNLPEQREAEYKLEVRHVSRIYLGFVGSIKQLEEILLSIIE